MPSPSSKVLPRKRQRTIWLSAAFALATLWASGVRADPWPQHVQKVATLDTRIAGLEKEIDEMIERKKTLEDSPELQALLTEMAKHHKALEQAAAEREDELAHMRYKHPEKGDAVKREYARYVVRSLDEMERAMGLEGKLDRLKHEIEFKYGVAPHAAPAAPPAAPRAPASAAEDRIVLKK